MFDLLGGVIIETGELLVKESELKLIITDPVCFNVMCFAWLVVACECCS